MAKRVFIGVGHGGKDPGAVGYIREAEANLVIALKMRDELMRHGVAVGISRITDEYDPLREEIAEAIAFKADIAIDVHCNAGGGKGFEVFKQTNGYGLQSGLLAACIENQVIVIGQESRGVKTKLNKAGTDYFGFLRQINAPAVIVEGFFVDSADAYDFDTVAEQQTLGTAYAMGVLDYFGIPWQDEQNEADLFADAVGVLHKAGVINSPEYWLANNYSFENVRLLIRKAADYIRKTEGATT